MSSARIVIIEQEQHTVDPVALRLRNGGYEVQIASVELDEWTKMQTTSPDLVLLDITPAGLSASQIIKRLRKSKRLARTPILLMTYHTDGSDTIPGLHAGAEDFIVKPLNPAELTARVELLLRRFARRGKKQDRTFQIGPIFINMDLHEVSVDGKPLKLTLTEFRLLTSLAEAGGRILERNLLIDQAIGMDAIVTDRTIDVHLTSLRRKLGRARSCLKTVRGVGYRLAGNDSDAG